MSDHGSRKPMQKKISHQIIPAETLMPRAPKLATKGVRS